VSFVRRAAPDRAQGELRSLRPSLNSPVVVVDELPAGPASAVMAELRGGGGARIALAIRSERTGQVALFAAEDEGWEARGAETALDAALSFAEGMGFLFDDDRLAAAPAAAQRLWEELVEASAPGGSPAAVPEELAREAPRAASAGAIGPSVPLTKFRSRPAGGELGRGRRATGPGPLSPPLARFRIAPGGRRP
jgi:hypothetical protein